MKRLLILTFFLFFSVFSFSQSPKVGPTKVGTAIYFDKSLPLRELIEKASKIDYAENDRNKELKEPRLYPYAESALPKGIDPIIQRSMGNKKSSNRDIIDNFAGQSGLSNPLDNNGSVGPNHFMQSINVTYSIYDKLGIEVVAPTAMNTLFAGVTGAGNNDGDPIIMYDGQADRWFAAEFSGAYSNPDYMLIAISETNDPTGVWYRWSFLMNGFPDYMKFGITEESYLMGANSGGDDVYAFERIAMIAGEANPQVVQFSNPNRPNSGFHAIMPMDTDGPFQATGSPGQFMTINDDAWNGVSDQLWIYDLDVDWNNPNAASFQRTQTIDVPAFDTDFGSNWENVSQPGNVIKLDAIPQVLMNRVQHRVFGNTQSVVCLHTVDVDGTDHAGLRWYELTRVNGGNWAVRQNGTYAPDNDSRWMGSIAQNNNHEISIGYNVSSNSVFPSIRYCGQSSVEYANASGIMDYAEVEILAGTVSQTSSERWGDYSNISIDPTDDNTFWFVTSYNLTGNQKGSRIASWNYTPPHVMADFSADNTKTCLGESVVLTDMTSGGPESWNWTITPATYSFVGGTNSSSQHPEIQFNNIGSYNIKLIVSNATSNDTLTKNNYISMQEVVARFSGVPTTVTKGSSVVFTDDSRCNPDTWNWTFIGGNPSSFTGQNPPSINYPIEGNYDVILDVSKSGNNDIESKVAYISVIPACTYCSTNYTDESDDFISNVTFRDIDNGSGGVGYEDFTNISTELNQGDTEQLQVSVTVNGPWSQHVFAWIDWNQNCDFEVGESYSMGVTDGTEGIHLLSKNIVVPVDAMLGTTRMRVAEMYDEEPSACTNDTYGEAEDYMVEVKTALPIILNSFDGRAEKNHNVLNWTVLSESNFSHFELERSKDAFSFINLGEVLSLNGEKQLSAYVFYDKKPLLKTYYRLKAVDLDGTYEYSKIIIINRINIENRITKIFPNPVMEELNVSVLSLNDRTASFRIINDKGQIIQMRRIELSKGLNEINFSVFLIPSGNYNLVIEGVVKPIAFVKL